ncbi:MAG: MATE family efflux transporter [Clostridiales bacterium]|nr:MATE family efflux transporter [Clostridiales bacterium]
MSQDLTKGKPFFTILKFAVPVIGGNLFQLFYTLADSVIVGRTLGADALAAVGSTSIFIYLILCFIQGITGGFGICLGHYFGAGDQKRIRQSVLTSVILCSLFSIVLTVICCVFSRQILNWMQTPAEIYDMAYDYMFAVLLGTGATVFYNMISNILRALGDSRTPLFFLVFSSILNIALDVIFIVPLGMGVAGAAWATVLSQLLSAIMSMASGMKKYKIFCFQKTDFIGIRGEIPAHLKIGFPMGFQMSVMCIGQLAMQGAVNALGAEAIAGYTAATKVDQISVLVNTAFGIAVSNFVAQNYGAGLAERIKKGFMACLCQASIVNIGMGMVMIFYSHMIVPLFVEHPTKEIIEYSNGYLLTVSPFYFILGILVICRSTIQSIGNSWAPFIACIVELVLRVVATTVLAKSVGYIGVCFATPLAWIGASIFLIPIYWQYAYFKRREIV